MWANETRFEQMFSRSGKMKVFEFNIGKGIYSFELEGIETEFHSHPAIEVILAENGEFSIATEKGVHPNLNFAIIGANLKHKLSALNCAIKIIMVEHHNSFVVSCLSQASIDLHKGYFFDPTDYKRSSNVINSLVQSIQNGHAAPEYDERVRNTIDFLNTHDLEYGQMLQTLCAISNLSESRLSHLFKSNTGISLKRYLIWAKLKATIRRFLNDHDDLFTALLTSGFYDQPHFSRSFRSMLGVKPSKAYNSRFVQVSGTRNQ